MRARLRRRQVKKGAHAGRPSLKSLNFLAMLVAWMTGRLNLLQDAIKVPSLRCLHRRKLLERHKLLIPKLLTDRQHVPIV